jgi:hypothetical protein
MDYSRMKMRRLHEGAKTVPDIGDLRFLEHGSAAASGAWPHLEARNARSRPSFDPMAVGLYCVLGSRRQGGGWQVRWRRAWRAGEPDNGTRLPSETGITALTYWKPIERPLRG